MVSFANDSNINDLKQLWRECFNADDAYLNMYFSNRYKHEHTLVYLDATKVVGMLTMLPIDIVVSQQIFTGRYVFAVATLQEYRGKGISTTLLKFADEYMSSNNINAAVLAPASENLFGFYKKHGYSSLFNIRQSIINTTELPLVNCNNTTICNMSAAEYANKRNGYFAKSSVYGKWGISQLEYIKTELEFFGGGFLSFNYGGFTACAAIECGKSDVKIKEIITDGEFDTMHILNCIKQKYKPNKILINQQEKCDTVFSSKILPYAMMKWYNNIDTLQRKIMEDKPYMSLVSD